MPSLLIVEDEIVFGKSLARFLIKAGYDCTLSQEPRTDCGFWKT